MSLFLSVSLIVHRYKLIGHSVRRKDSSSQWCKKQFQTLPASKSSFSSTSSNQEAISVILVLDQRGYLSFTEWKFQNPKCKLSEPKESDDKSYIASMFRLQMSLPISETWTWKSRPSMNSFIELLQGRACQLFPHLSDRIYFFFSITLHLCTEYVLRL